MAGCWDLTGEERKAFKASGYIDGDQALIPLTKGEYTLVDTADFAWLSETSWSFSYDPKLKGGYAVGSFKDPRRRVAMHRLLTGAQKGQEVDHINGDPLDNRRSNLRICTRSENMQNRKSWKTTAGGSIYKGVIRGVSGWQVTLSPSVSEEIEAAELYDDLATAVYGAFTRKNFPDRETEIERLRRQVAASTTIPVRVPTRSRGRHVHRRREHPRMRALRQEGVSQTA